MTTFERILDILCTEAMHVCAGQGMQFTPSLRGGNERSDVVIATIGFGGRDLRGAFTISAEPKVWESMMPDVFGPRPFARPLVADFAGELSNLIVGRFRNGLLRRGVEVGCGTPTTIAGAAVELACLFAQRSEWRLLSSSEGSIRVRLDISFREGFSLPATESFEIEPVVTDLFF
jgi:CheY-specific phosphatase CheX